MDWDEAIKILQGAGYHVEAVAADQWRVSRAGHAFSTLVRFGTLIALAESLVRVGRTR